MRVGIRIVLRQILEETEMIPERPNPQNVCNLMQCCVYINNISRIEPHASFDGQMGCLAKHA